MAAAGRPVEMILEVKWCGSPYAVSVATTATVGELKLRIRDATGLPTKRQNLLWPDVDGALEDDVVLLSSLPVKDKPEVNLISLKENDFESYQALFWKQKRLISGEILIEDRRVRHKDFDGSLMNLFTGLFKLDILAIDCSIRKATKEFPVMISSFNTIKNFRHQNDVIVECFYKEGNQFRLVLSPQLDGTVQGWASAYGVSTLFCITDGSTKLSDLYRQIILDLCGVLMSLLKEGICARKVSESNLYLKVLSETPRLRVLIDEVEYLKDNAVAREKQITELWSGISNMVLASVKRCQVPSLSINSEGFCKFIGKQSTTLFGKHAIKKLNNYPDKWSNQEKGAYLIQLIAADKAQVWSLIRDSGLKWPKNENEKLPVELDALIKAAVGIGHVW
ncbi:unnamed protein product [Urochloa decumbens]|uniref:Ubiquitin-like domain-containing protein n=1 Tax=Urochloa decumbens TaxID=240449 RepID=A0ABC8XHV8_9POAL